MKTIGTLTLNPSLDRHCTVERIETNKKLRAHDVRREPGGGGVNVARAAFELGGETLPVFAAGGDNGRMLAALIEQEGLDAQAVEVGGETRENVTVHDASDDEQMILVMPGAVLTDEDLTRCLHTMRERIADMGLLVISGSLPDGSDPRTLTRFVDLAGEYDVNVLVDTSGEALGHALAAGPYLVKPNLRELSQSTQREITDDDSIAAAARAMIDEHGVTAVVVSKGADGAMLVTRDGVESQSSPDVEVRSRVGAGDSMVAGIALKLAEGSALPHALRFGLAAGAAAVMTPGSELCRAADVRRLHQEMLDAARARG